MLLLSSVHDNLDFHHLIHLSALPIEQPREIPANHLLSLSQTATARPSGDSTPPYATTTLYATLFSHVLRTCLRPVSPHTPTELSQALWLSFCLRGVNPHLCSSISFGTPFARRLCLTRCLSSSAPLFLPLLRQQQSDEPDLPLLCILPHLYSSF